MISFPALWFTQSEGFTPNYEQEHFHLQLLKIKIRKIKLHTPPPPPLLLINLHRTYSKVLQKNKNLKTNPNDVAHKAMD